MNLAAGSARVEHVAGITPLSEIKKAIQEIGYSAVERAGSLNKRRKAMLFMITQVHTPETCPKDAGGADVLIDKDAQGLTLKGRWGAWAHHTIWYLVEADNLEAIQRFLDPGMKRCTCTVEPVGEAPIHR